MQKVIRSSWLGLLVFALVLAAREVAGVAPSARASQAPFLVKDINTTFTAVDSQPELSRCFPNLCFFITTAGSLAGKEPWRTDGTPEGTFLLKDINPTPSAGSMSQMYVSDPIGGVYLFAADDGSHGAELWATDGTSEGTRLVKDIATGSGSSTPSGFAVFQGRVFFWATTSESGKELWVSDGTEAGTTLLKDTKPGAGSSYAGPIGAVGGGLLFFGTGGLWRSDGTADGTSVLAGIWGDQLYKIGTTAFFRASETGGKKALWKTDGTEVGTALVKGGFAGQVTRFGETGGKLVFLADDGTSGAEPWVSDGTPSGTALLMDINPGSASSDMYPLASLGTRLVFRASEPAHGSELWSTDGTPTGTALVKDLDPGTRGSGPWGSGLLPGGLLAFSACDRVNGCEPWKTDGTEAGTALVKDVRPGPWNSIDYMTVLSVGTFAVFAANDGVTGAELWRTDGTAAGTVMVGNLAPDRPNGSSPEKLTALGDAVVFIAADGSQSSLWRSDGTEAGTVPLAPMSIKWDQTGDLPAPTAGGVVYQHVEIGSSTELWRSDGTAGGTFSLGRVTTMQSLASGGDRVYFGQRPAGTSAKLWTSDGTVGGTRLLKDISPGTGLFHNGLYYFPATEPSAGTSGVWVSDGTEDGTHKLKAVGSAGFSILNGKVVFFGTGGLWTSDGTEEGTRLLAELDPSRTGQQVTTVGDLLFFIRREDNYTIQLWRSDGTTSGTFKAKDIPTSQLSLGTPTELGGQLLLMALDDWGKTTLWRSDGSPSGTMPIASFEGGWDYQGTPPSLHRVGHELVFAGGDVVHGTELWATDGTVDGTRLIAEIVPGMASSNPRGMEVVGSTLFFRASTPEHGVELWAMPLSGLDDPRHTSTMVRSSNVLSPFGLPVTLTVRVVAAGGGVPTGTVTLREGATVLGILPLVPSEPSTAVASIVTAAFEAGDHTLIAEYAGDLAHDASVALPVNQSVVPAPTTTAIDSSPNPVGDGQPVTLGATVSTGLQIAAQGTITFTDAAGGVLGTATLDAAGHGAITVPQLTAGTHFIDAAYSGEARFQPSASGLLRQAVTGAAECPSFTSVGGANGLGLGSRTDGSRLYAVDLQDQGRADLVATSPRGYGASVALSDQNGRFGTPAGIFIGNVAGLVFADFDGDTLTDIAGASGYGLVVLYNQGGGLLEAVWPPLDLTSVQATVVGDFNLDSRPDIAMASGNTVSVVLNGAGGAFRVGPSSYLGAFTGPIATADLDGDATPELLVGHVEDGNIGVLRGNGDGSFQPPTLWNVGGGSIRSLEVADLNADGHADVVAVPSGPREFVVLLGSGDGTAQPGLHYPAEQPSLVPVSVLIGDLDGDGILDIVTVPAGDHAEADVELRLGHGDGTFGSPQRLSTFPRVGDAVVADFNGDGKLDLAVAEHGGSPIDVLLNGCGPLPTHSTLEVAATTDGAGHGLLLTATVASTGGTPAGTVTFLDGDDVLGTGSLDVSGQAHSLVDLDVGASHTLRVRYWGSNDHAPSESAPVTWHPGGRLRRRLRS